MLGYNTIDKLHINKKVPLIVS